MWHKYKCPDSIVQVVRAPEEAAKTLIIKIHPSRQSTSCVYSAAMLKIKWEDTISRLDRVLA